MTTLNDDQNDEGTVPIEGATSLTAMDPEAEMIMKQDLEDRLKAGEKLDEEEMELAEHLLGEKILPYLDKEDLKSPPPEPEKEKTSSLDEDDIDLEARLIDEAMEQEEEKDDIGNGAAEE